MCPVSVFSHAFGLVFILASIGLNVWCLRQPYPEVSAENNSQYRKRSQVASVFLAAGCVMEMMGMALGSVA